MPPSPPSSPPFAATLTLEAGPTRALTGALISAYVAATIASLWLPTAWRAGVVVALVAALVAELVRMRRPVRLQWRAEGGWYDLERPTCGPLQLAAPTFVSRWLIVVVLVEPGARPRRYLITRAAVAPAQWRRLLARLRVEGGGAACAVAGWRGVPPER